MLTPNYERRTVTPVVDHRDRPIRSSDGPRSIATALDCRLVRDGKPVREILEHNPFHAALEAAKSLADRRRTLTGVGGDVSAVVDATLVAGQRSGPHVAINAFATQTDQTSRTTF